MWYLIAGNLMSLIVYLTFTNFLLDLQDLNIYQRFICWFFIEHLQDDCNFSAGKFFLTDIDFRTLIKNVLIISRNFIFLAQALRPLEFFILNILLIALFIYNKYGNFNTYSIYVNSFIFFCYVFIFYSFLCFNTTVIYFFINLILSFFLGFTTILIYLFICYSYLLLCSNTNYVFFLTRLLIYLSLLLLTIFILSIIFMCFLNSGQENIIQEFCLKILILYSYLVKH